MSVLWSKDRRKAIEVEIITPANEVDARLDEIESQIADLDISIDKLTNHADKLDYTVAVASGILTGFLDVFLGEYIRCQNLLCNRQRKRATAGCLSSPRNYGII